MEHLLNYKLSWLEHHGSPHLICIYLVLTSSEVHAKNWSMVKKYFKTAYLSQFLTYIYETPLFGIVGKRCLLWDVKRRSRPTQSRDIEQNVKIVRISVCPLFDFCDYLHVFINISWLGWPRTTFHPVRKMLLLLTIPKSGVSYLYVKKWLRYAILKYF